MLSKLKSLRKLPPLAQIIEQEIEFTERNVLKAQDELDQKACSLEYFQTRLARLRAIRANILAGNAEPI